MTHNYKDNIASNYKMLLEIQSHICEHGYGVFNHPAFLLRKNLWPNLELLIFECMMFLLKCFYVWYAIVRLKMQSTPDDLLSYTFATFPSLAPSHLFSGRACALHTSKRHFLTLSTSLILSSSPFPSTKWKFKKLSSLQQSIFSCLLSWEASIVSVWAKLWVSNSQSADP